MDDRGSELADLRRRAYSRSGTEDDRRQLAEFEDRPARFRKSRWLAAGIGAVAGATLATVVTLAVVTATRVEQEPTPASALSVFERDASGIDDPANLLVPLDEVFRDAEGSYVEDLEDLALRWVGGPDGTDVYAVRFREDDAYTICLIVEAIDQARADCTSEADFALNGIRLPAFGLDLKWGPSGTEVWVNSLR